MEKGTASWLTLALGLALFGAAACERRESPDADSEVLPAITPASVASAPVDRRCPTFRATPTRGRVRSSEIDEASGIAASRKNARLLWVHNDSGDSARVFAIRRDGKEIAILNLAGVEAADWEDMALGPGPVPKQDYLYLGDIGDNARERKQLEIHRVPEPVVARDGPKELVVKKFDTLKVRYGDGKSYDSETLLVDPKTGDMYLVTKDGDTGTSHVFRAPAPLLTGATISLSRVATLAFGKGSLGTNPWATAGDISLNGDMVVIRTYETAFVWRRRNEKSLVDALKERPCQVPVAIEPQGESITFSADGRGYFTLSEEEEQPVNFFELVP